MEQNDHHRIKAIGSKVGEAMWEEIDDLVKRWTKRNPVGANYNRYFNQGVRDGLAKQGKGVTATLDSESKGGKAGIRTSSVISVHPELVSYIEAFYPRFFESKENVRKFGTIYKMFRIPEKYHQ